MTKRMLVDATHPEETRVAVVSGNWLSDFDFERASKQQLKGNIYLAKVIRIEPSLQAAFVEYGGNRHGFLPFTEIHPDYYRIPMADRPHDEEPAEEDDDNDTEESIVPPEEIAAAAAEVHAAEVEEARHEQQEQEAQQIENPEHPSAAEPYSQSAPEGEFGVTHGDDLGLITDFGNALVVDGSVPAPSPTPIETVGGEMAESAIVEERRQYPPRHRYKIQEVVKRRQVMLIQVVKEERGNKGAALTTFLSLAGRYCVLMPNTERGGGVSRKITSHTDRRRMKEMLDQLEIPGGMAVILRTAGMEQEPAEIQRDLEYLLRLWNGIREQTLVSTAPALIYEEANLIKRSMRDLFAQDVSEVLVSGKQGYELARDFMRTIMPDDEEKVKLYTDPIPLFFRFNVEKQIDHLYTPTVQLRSGGYIVINPTEALVSIDVNSGKATRERNIEGTALKTNLEAAEEIARQLRLRDLAGLVVIDFIDMEDGRNNAAVERRLKEAMRNDRARLQIGRISPFGLLELSRQRLRPSLMEINFEKCPHCAGVGFVRSVDSAALSILRMIEEEGIRQGSAELTLHVPTKIALYILNQKRPALNEIERRYGLTVLLHSDDELVPPDFKLERTKMDAERAVPAVNVDQILAESSTEAFPPPIVETGEPLQNQSDEARGEGRNFGRRRGRFGFGRNRDRHQNQDRQQNQQQPFPPPQQQIAEPRDANGNVVESDSEIDDDIGNATQPVSNEGAPPYPQQGGPMQQNDGQRRRRRGRRGGRGRRGHSDRPPRDGEVQTRDNNFRPRQEHGDNRNRDWNRNNNNGGGRPQTPYQPSTGGFSSSIPEIDTTPRVPEAYSPPQAANAPHTPRQHSAPPPSMEIRQSPRSEPRQPISSQPYEIVDQPSDKPKGGWWKKLTGQ